MTTTHRGVGNRGASGTAGANRMPVRAREAGVLSPEQRGDWRRSEDTPSTGGRASAPLARCHLAQSSRLDGRGSDQDGLTLVSGLPTEADVALAPALTPRIVVVQRTPRPTGSPPRASPQPPRRRTALTPATASRWRRHRTSTTMPADPAMQWAPVQMHRGPLLRRRRLTISRSRRPPRQVPGPAGSMVQHQSTRPSASGCRSGA